MTDNSTTAPDGATAFTTNLEKPVPLNLECITGDIGTIRVFCEGLEHFINDVRACVRAEADRDSILREVNHADVMAYEIKQRVEKLQEGINEFIDAATPAQLWAERKPA
jgi:hypothetical protein